MSSPFAFSLSSFFLAHIDDVVVVCKPVPTRTDSIDFAADPGEEAEREEKLIRMHWLRVILEAIQFGIYFHRPGDPNTTQGYFSRE